MDYTATTSGSKVADGVIFARPCRVHSIMLETDGTNVATCILYDNPSAASGTVLASLSCLGADRQATWSLDCGVEANSGVYLDIGGTGAKVVIHYSPL
jgi:hypothetical protein